MSQPAVPPGPEGPPLPQVAPAYYRPPTNGMAITSMILGILGIVGMIWIISPILALVFGYVAKGQIDRSGGAQEGRGMAVAGIVLGWVGIVLGMAVVAWMWWWFTHLPEIFENLPRNLPSISPIPAPQ